MRVREIAGISAMSVLLSACAGLGQIETPVQHFDQATHTAATAEKTFLSTEQATECEDQFYTQAAAFADGSASNFDLTGHCVSHDVSVQQSKIRDDLMSAVVLYADKMAALAAVGDDKTLATNSTTLAQNLGQLGSAGGFTLSSGDTAIEHGVEAAFVAIASMALDQTKFDDVRKAAQAMQPHLAIVITALKDENYGVGQSLNAHLGHIEITLREVVAQSAHDAPGCAKRACAAPKNRNATQTFSTLIQARGVVAGANPIDTQPLIPPPGTTTAPVDSSKAVNDALDAVASGNQAIANASEGGVFAAATDLYNRASNAVSFYNGIAKAK